MTAAPADFHVRCAIDALSKERKAYPPHSQQAAVTLAQQEALRRWLTERRRIHREP